MGSTDNVGADDGLQDLSLTSEEAEGIRGMRGRFQRKLRFSRGGSGDIRTDKAARAVVNSLREGRGR